MNYQEAIDFMFSSLPMYQRVGKAAYKSDLNNTLALDEHFGSPHKHFKTIHVAGTNGKGSVSHSLAAVLQKAGYKTGLYTSPHLVDYRERIRINGEKISEDYVCQFINENMTFLQDLQPSFFEMSVALAFNYFKDNKVDVAVVEVGMGGRLDSTNIIMPELTIITNISFDHTQFLGDTLEKIAIEKAGIIKPHVPVIIGEKQAETEPVFTEIAKQKEAQITFASDMYNIENAFPSYDYEYGKFEVCKEEIAFDLFGEYQKKNFATILAAVNGLRRAGFEISLEAERDAYRNVKKITGLHGRWEIVSRQPLTICDTGHNFAGLSYNMQQLSQMRYNTLHLVIGFVNDKDVEKVLGLFPTKAQYYFTQADIPRAMSATEVFEFAKRFDLKGEIYKNVSEAYLSAKKNAGENDVIFVGGSTFIVGDFFKYFGF